ncbi:hypothetical protein JOS77_27030 [Chromobacterium haemolyticum]|uniref:hypothetical protein n=1 Tax=Chromobacterium haemolyticum TaxID=394935 RepID=UPI000DEEC3AA|nr:hypothetical protein [Chromobacterium haemolyticum]UGA37583.1 hypothetical protein JOS77_27030 [Chromobacterium haemolyticum]
MANESRAPNWHFEKRINLGDVLTTLTLVGTLLGFMLTLDRRLTVVEEKQTQQVVVDRQQDERQREQTNEVKEQLKDIGSKLDKLVERQLDMRRPQ